jgi:hypothetical protein
VALQADCALQRDDVSVIYDSMAERASRVDRLVSKIRSFGPLIAVGGAALLIGLGPSRGMRLLSRGLKLGVFANQALRFLR